MSPEPILVVKRMRQHPGALRRLLGKAGRRDGLFSRDTHDAYLVCGGIDSTAEGGVYRVVFTLWPAATLARTAVAPAAAGATGAAGAPGAKAAASAPRTPQTPRAAPAMPEPYEDAIHWRGLLGDDWERTTPRDEDLHRLQRRLRAPAG